MSEILVIGSLNMDLVVATQKIPRIGETVLGSGFSTVPGGKGANQAVAAARLGAHVDMIGCVGEDLFGKELISNLKANGVGVECVKEIKDVPTGIAMIVINEGNNFIIVDPGANFEVSCEFIKQYEYKIKQSDIIVIQLEIPLETVKTAVNIAFEHRKKIILNPAPAQQLPDDILNKITLLTPNETECEILTGIRINTTDDAAKAIQYLMNKGVKQVVVTMGSKGAVYNIGNRIVNKPARKVEAVDTTAAGDSFTAALAVGMSRELDFEQSVEFANVVGSLTVTKKGAQSSLPYIDEVMEIYLANKNIY